MLIDTLLAQKQEKEELLKRPYIRRDKMKTAESWMQSSLIKVILGPRRAGKSVFALQLTQGIDAAYINFEDESFSKVKSYDEILKALHIVYGKTKTIIFDEIQNLPNWEMWVNKLHRRGYHLIITGSNARLLSRELSTSLTGRHIAIELLPFSFHEFCRAKQIEGISREQLSHFMIHGGFPEIVLFPLNAREYLSTLIDSILLKDVSIRHHLRYQEKITSLSSYLIETLTSEISPKNLAKALDFSSTITLDKYLRYLEESYLLIRLKKYSFKTKEGLRPLYKSYMVDNGFFLAKANQWSSNQGKLMENLVFTELLKQRTNEQKIFYYKTRNNKEVDFIIRDGAKTTSALQICANLNDHHTEKRELSALWEAGEELNCTDLKIISWDEEREIKKKGKIIQIIPLWKWIIRE
jgi:predicted AAA+ superfamily ATPase